MAFFFQVQLFEMSSLSCHSSFLYLSFLIMRECWDRRKRVSSLRCLLLFTENMYLSILDLYNLYDSELDNFKRSVFERSS